MSPSNEQHRHRRASGILLHPTALPGPHGSGDLGPAARRFADWLASAGQTLWQVLPLTPPGAGDSPYASDSAFAGNPLLIDLGALAAAGWLTDGELHAEGGRGSGDEAGHASRPAAAGVRSGDLAAGRVNFPAVRRFRMSRLRRAAERFFAGAERLAEQDFVAFCAAEADWLDDYALFAALGTRHAGDWTQWPAPLARRVPAALAAARRELAEEIDFQRFCQWCFARQWAALKAHANARGVELVGDLPIFVSAHSADVWAHPQLFDLDVAGRPRVVAGVPPDYFSDTGQRWGNPLYVWERHAAEGYRWWIARLAASLRQFDRLRIDHFRGFAAHWEIDADAETAIDGRWQPGPGAPLFLAARAALGRLPLIAEDLGVITEDVVALRESLGLPGMRILQFAFDGRADNPYLPHNHSADSVVYTGTHDNDTTPGWWAGCDEATRVRVREYLASNGEAIHWDLIRTAFASVADTAIVPLQDVLGLGSEARMNTPGAAQGCWAWRFEEDQLAHWHAPLLANLARRYGRGGAGGD